MFVKKSDEIVKEQEPKVVEDSTPINNFVSDGRMTISKKGMLELADREGLALTPYLDIVGVKTVGLGATKSDIKDLDNWAWDKTIGIQEAVDLYKKHVQPYANAVAAALKVPVKQHQFDALVSITYNIGVGGMRGSTFMKRINGRESTQSIVNAILMWDKPAGIKGRRKKEADLFAKGIYQNKDGSVDRVLVNPVTHKPRYSGRVKIEQYL